MKNKHSTLIRTQLGTPSRGMILFVVGVFGLMLALFTGAFDKDPRLNVVYEISNKKDNWIVLVSRTFQQNEKFNVAEYISVKKELLDDQPHKIGSYVYFYPEQTSQKTAAHVFDDIATARAYANGIPNAAQKSQSEFYKWVGDPLNYRSED